MELYLKKEIVNKMLIGAPKGLLAGEQFYDICYVHDVYPGITVKELMKKEEEDLNSVKVIGDFCLCAKRDIIEPKTLFKDFELQWIKLLLQPKITKSGARKTRIDSAPNAQPVRMKAYVQTLDVNQAKTIVKPVKIVII